MNPITSDSAPAAIGPYSQAMSTNSKLIFCSGQLPLVPQTMEVIEGGVREQTEQILSNIEVVLQEAGLELSAIVKSTVFLTDMADFAEMNEVYTARLGEHKPARSTIQVAALPMGDKGVRLEIEVIAEAV